MTKSTRIISLILSFMIVFNFMFSSLTISFASEEDEEYTSTGNSMDESGQKVDYVQKVITWLFVFGIADQLKALISVMFGNVSIDALLFNKYDDTRLAFYADTQVNGHNKFLETPSADSGILAMVRGYYSIFNGNDFIMQYVLDIEDGYLYYSNKDKDTEIVSIWRKLAAGGEGEIIVPDASGFSEIEVFFVQGDMIFVADENSLSCWDIQTKMFIDTIPINHIVMDEPYYRFNVADGQVYYLRENGLYKKTPGMDNETLLVSGDTEYMTALALSDQYFYMVNKNGLVNSVWRIPVTGSSLDDAELLYRNPDERVSDQEENGWAFYEYENSVVIYDYTGNETYAAAPAQIHGKPVISVGLTSYNKDRPLLAFSIPEGVLHLGKLCSDHLVNITLPSSLIRMYDWGYPGVFQTAVGCVIQYAGTQEEWQALEDTSWSDYFEGPKENVRILLVICADGIWKDPATVSEKMN